jgi:hypothetical protein
VGELWRPAGGAYNVDWVLTVMVRGLEEELRARMSGSKIYGANRKSPSLPLEVAEAILDQRTNGGNGSSSSSSSGTIAIVTTTTSSDNEKQPPSVPTAVPPQLTVMRQGGDVMVIVKMIKKSVGWLIRKR